MCENFVPSEKPCVLSAEYISKYHENAVKMQIFEMYMQNLRESVAKQFFCEEGKSK